MALETQAIVEGRLIRTKSRSVTRTSDGQVFTFRNALIIGDHSMAEVSFDEEQEKDLPGAGEEIRAVVSVGIYRDGVQVRLEQVLSGKPSTVKPHAAA